MWSVIFLFKLFSVFCLWINDFSVLSFNIIYLDVAVFPQADLHFYNFNYNMVFYVWAYQCVLTYDFWKTKDKFVKVENADVVTFMCKITSLETETVFKKLVIRELKLLKRKSA